MRTINYKIEKRIIHKHIKLKNCMGQCGGISYAPNTYNVGPSLTWKAGIEKKGKKMESQKTASTVVIGAM